MRARGDHLTVAQRTGRARRSGSFPAYTPAGEANLHLADAPGLVGRRVGHLDALGQAMPVHVVDVVHPDRQPDALVARLALVLRRRQRALPAAALRTLAQEDLALAGADGP